MDRLMKENLAEGQDGAIISGAQSHQRTDLVS